jgi:hypothetical protein
LRAGAGRLQLVVADESAVPLSIAVPEARVLGVPAGRDGLPEEVLELARDADVIAIRPGLDDIGQTIELMGRWFPFTVMSRIRTARRGGRRPATWDWARRAVGTPGPGSSPVCSVVVRARLRRLAGVRTRMRPAGSGCHPVRPDRFPGPRAGRRGGLHDRDGLTAPAATHPDRHRELVADNSTLYQFRFVMFDVVGRPFREV